jgi:hypothetical protein
MVLNFVAHAVDVYDTTDDYALLYSVTTNATTEFYFPEAVLSPDGRESSTTPVTAHCKSSRWCQPTVPGPMYCH